MYSGDVEGRLSHGSRAQVLGQVLSQENVGRRDNTNPWRKFFDPPELTDAKLYVMLSVY